MASTEHSAKYKKLRWYYIRGYWSAKMLADAVVKGWITEDEYEEITGEAYESDESSESDESES